MRSVDGSPLGLISLDYLHVLIAANVVSAIGTRSKIKHFRLTDSQPEVDRIIGQHAREDRVRQRSPGDMLRAMMAGRATVYRQKLAVVQSDGHTRRCVIFQHKRAFH